MHVKKKKRNLRGKVGGLVCIAGLNKEDVGEAKNAWKK